MYPSAQPTAQVWANARPGQVVLCVVESKLVASQGTGSHWGAEPVVASVESHEILLVLELAVVS